MIKTLVYFFLCALTARAQLTVTVSPPKIAGQKAVILLTMTNHLAEPIDSARAACFLLDDQGKMVGQSAKWVIGGAKDRAAVPPKAGTTFNFVITGPQPFTTTNLTARVAFTSLILAGGQVADPNKDTIIKQSQKN